MDTNPMSTISTIQQSFAWLPLGATHQALAPSASDAARLSSFSCQSRVIDGV